MYKFGDYSPTNFKTLFLSQEETVTIHQALYILKNQKRSDYKYEQLAEQIVLMREFQELNPETIMDLCEKYQLPQAFIRALFEHPDFKKIPLRTSVLFGKEVADLWGRVKGAEIRAISTDYFKAIVMRGDWKRLSLKEKIQFTVLSGFHEKLETVVSNSKEWQTFEKALRVA